MSASQVMVGANLQALSDIELQAQQELIQAELKHRSEQRLERLFYSFSHLNKQELIALKEKITNHLEQSSITLQQPIPLQQPVTYAEELSDFSDPTAGFEKFDAEPDQKLETLTEPTVEAVEFQELELSTQLMAEVVPSQESESPTEFLIEAVAFQELESTPEVAQANGEISQGSVSPILPNLKFNEQPDFHLRHVG